MVWWGHCAAICVALIAVWILISALDDLFIALIFLFRKPPPFPWPADSELAAASERRIAILVPLWQEHEVIRQMLRHNLSVIRYGNYDIFVGLYPNDLRTREAVEEVVRQDARVHIVLCPHDGPTSKGDCLNWTFKSMVEHENGRRLDFAAVVTHDAEDLIQLGAYVSGSNPVLDASIRLRPELLEFLRQHHQKRCTLEETLSRLQELAARLEMLPALQPGAKR